MASKQSLFFFSLLFLQQLRFSASQSTVKAAYWYSESEFSADDIDSSLFTVLYCSFAKLNNETFQVYIPPELTQKFATFTTTVQRKNPSVKTLISIGGGSANKTDYIAMASDWNRRQAFIQSSIRLARDNNFHGLDLDWEYPANETQMTQFGYLVDEWRTAVADEASDTGRSPLLLVAAVFYSPDYYSVLYVVPALARSLDWINVMAYDFYTPGSGSSPTLTKPPAALYKDPTERYGGDAGVSSWIGEDFPAKKIVLGLPFYGYAWRLVDANRNGLYAPANGPALSGESTMGYTEIREFIANHQNDGKAVFNGTVVADYCYGGTTWIGYDDVQSISGKVSYAKDKGLLGYFGWHIGADADMVLSREGEVVDRPTLSASALSRVEKILSLSPDRIRASVLNTKANQRLYGLLIKLPPPRESIVPPADLLSAVPPGMKFSLPTKRKDKGPASTSTASKKKVVEAAPIADVAATPRGGVLRIEPSSKRQKVGEQQAPPAAEGSSGLSRSREKLRAIAAAAAAAASKFSSLPGSRVGDPEHPVYDVDDVDLTHGLRLPPRFSLPLQAIYSFFKEEHWEAYAEESIMDRQRLTVKRQISALELALQNYVDLEVHFKGERASAAAEREITALRSIRDELSTDLEVEKAKLKTLEDSVENVKTRSFEAGFSEGSSKGVEAYLSSPEYQQRQRDVAAKAVADFLASGDFGRIADARVEAFKASAEFEGLIADRVEKYKSSAEFEELQLTLMQSAGDQIFDRFRKMRPDIDLSFWDESDSEVVEVVEPVQGAEVEVVEPVPGPEDAEGANAGGGQTAGGDGEP